MFHMHDESLAYIDSLVSVDVSFHCCREIIEMSFGRVILSHVWCAGVSDERGSSRGGPEYFTVHNRNVR